MSELLRCDKCKTEIPNITHVERKILHNLTIRENYYTTKYVSNKFESRKHKDIHLCKKCLEQFELWLGLP